MLPPREAREIWRGEGLDQDALALVHGAWEEACGDWPLACTRGCAVCCSDRLALTTLEGRVLARALEQGGRAHLLARLAAQTAPLAARPEATFNTLARRCLAQEEISEQEPRSGETGACPLLEEGLCLAYQARPLGCRLMVSRQPCLQGGSAWQDPWWLSLATALHQVVEHLDLGGGWGLLPAVMAALAGREGPGLLACQPLPGIPAPPQHQARLQEVLERLWRQPLHGQPLGWWLRALNLP